MRAHIKRHDTARKIQSTLSIDDVAVNLSGATVMLVWSRCGISERKVATIESAAQGIVSYEMTAGDVDEAGIVLMEWEITFATGKILTVPTLQPIELMIVADLE